MARPATLAPVARESTVGHVARELRTAIMYGELAPGSQLFEVALAEKLQVSRGPLREGIQRLVQEGLVRTEPNRGVFVVELGSEDVQDVYRARTAIERGAAEVILERDPQGAADQLDAAMLPMAAAAVDLDVNALTDADLDFHKTLVGLADSPRLRRMHDTLLVETRLCIAAANATYDQLADALKEHRAIVDALRTGRRDVVDAAIEAHMLDALTRLSHDGPDGNIV